MNYKQLVQEITKKRSFLCVGLDTDINKIPSFLKKADNPVFEFNKRIIDATSPYAVAFKLNTAFYESYGVQGWLDLEKSIKYIKTYYPDSFIIADAKRGDIGNTSKMYAKAFFESMSCDAITVAPYMGKDSVSPFLESDGKWAILLALTSNEGAFDFQTIGIKGSENVLFETVLSKSKLWGTKENMMYVVGATKAESFKKIREIIPDHFLLVPGVGAQGGDLEQVAKYGMNKSCGLLVNSSRAIIFADNTEDFDKIAAEKAKEMQLQMDTLLKSYGL
ncbi:MAG: orotidine 5'-phosphate decarboxylase [Bacteroidetes bacterium GWF2_33_16]|nr:MAG: orotidine 5'-phosphate decarboxylase [Bacteroidetes bacterium GWE2_32_14]OFY06871.1 MAG: orotidine 5'-phosphate decarboxylase [Bacteroidetes bacterium GWF2_33_16]